MRTNCLDCLDRTNVAQMMVCLKVLSENVNDWGVKLFEDGKANPSYIFLWAMSGDSVSKIYSGTHSVLTKVTLKGHENPIDKLTHLATTMRRYQKQMVTDDFKQGCILIIQGLDPL